MWGHPQDVLTLLDVHYGLLAQVATGMAVDHDLDRIANADEVTGVGDDGGGSLQRAVRPR